MTTKFKVGQWIARADVVKLGKIRWEKFREKYKSEHTTTRDFAICGRFPDFYSCGDGNVFVYKDGDLFWADFIGYDDKQIAYETVIEYIGEKEMNKFDLKTQPWFIRVNNEEESKAAQEWLFEHGLTWWGGKTDIDYNGMISVLQSSPLDSSTFCWSGSDEDAVEDGKKEIKLSFETITNVVGVVFPEADELVELNGKKYKKSDLEAALSKLNPVGG